jgi:hypothetical protein
MRIEEHFSAESSEVRGSQIIFDSVERKKITDKKDNIIIFLVYKSYFFFMQLRKMY